MAVNIHITIIELNALHTKRQNLFQELDAVIHLLMEAKHWGLRKRDRKSGSAGMPRPISYAVFCLKKKIQVQHPAVPNLWSFLAPDSALWVPYPLSLFGAFCLFSRRRFFSCTQTLYA